MADLIIQPTAKFLKAGTILAALVFIGLEVVYLTQWRDPSRDWLMILPPLILLWPVIGWIKRGMKKATITGDRLRYDGVHFEINAHHSVEQSAGRARRSKPLTAYVRRGRYRLKRRERPAG